MNITSFLALKSCVFPALLKSSRFPEAPSSQTRLFDWVAVLFLVVVFAWAGLAKWNEVESLQQTVLRYRLVNEAIAGVVAFVLPPFELAIAGALLWRRSRLAAAWSALFLSAAFFFITLQAWGRGIDLECGCFGEQLSFSQVGWHLGVLFLMMIAASWLCFPRVVAFQKCPKVEEELHCDNSEPS